MATSPRRKFSGQLKVEAVQMVVQNDRQIAQVVKELRINDGTLGNWVKLYREETPEPDPERKPSDRVRLAELEAEVRELRMENEFLKKPPWIQIVKATLWFSASSGVRQAQHLRGRVLSSRAI